MSIEQQIGALVEASNNLTDAVNNKVGEIDKKVDEAVSAVPDAIRDNFEIKYVHIDPSNGNDNSVNGPFKTIRAAVESVPNGGSVVIYLPNGTTEQIVDFDHGVNIGSRRVSIVGGYSGMLNDGKFPAVLRPIVGHNTTHNRSYMRGYILGDPGGRLTFSYVKLLLPRQIPGTSVEHGGTGAFLSGGLNISFHNYTLMDPMIAVEDGTTNPMYLIRSGARDAKGCIQDFILSLTVVETALAAALVDVQYALGTMRFAAYSSSFSDADGATVSFANMFTGLSFGSHGYATNLLAPQDVVKQPV